MKMNKGALIMALLMAAHVCNAAVLPSGSRFDPRNQIVSYNPNNTTIINSAVGYTTTLVFDEDETVISARTGCFYLASTASPYGFQCVKRYRYSVVGSKATAALCRLPATTDNQRRSSHTLSSFRKIVFG